jgi:hypothetical protein
MWLVGRARDVVTPPAGGAPVVLAEDGFEARLGFDRTILAIASDPPRPAVAGLVGRRGGGGLRQVLQAVRPEERRRGTPLHLLLDDISGASLVAGWAWSQWDPDWLASLRAAAANPELAKAFPDRTGVCIGFAPGSSGLDRTVERSGTPTPDLRHPDDPEGWHAYAAQQGPGMRRARRIDLTLDDGVVAIDSAFQDSASTPAGGRAVVHEYRLTATVDAQTQQVLSLQAEPRVLPFAECPGAAANIQRLIGATAAELRAKVLVELKGVAGCTHLNDALRMLADAPGLLRLLERAPS